ncbi:MAG: metal-dependent transcriptional regulator [Anaerolineaceae bacterium]|nr:metal-dependent transcriptional regulator [Anaerolineaceae bacterium]
MKISESAQERLEQLWSLTNENGGAHPVEAATADEELSHMSLVVLAPAGPILTATGQEQAALAIRRHRLAERLLADVLVTEEALIDERACGLEHALFDGLDESICTLLGHPRFCPHGKPIPAGRCCQEERASVGQLVSPLNELESGDQGQIAYIQMQDPLRLQKLMAMGVLPGVPLRVLRNSPSFVFEAGYSQFAVDEDIAADIYVRLKR